MATSGFALARAGAEAKRPKVQETDEEMAARLNREFNGGRATRAAEKPKKKEKVSGGVAGGWSVAGAGS